MSYELYILGCEYGICVRATGYGYTVLEHRVWVLGFPTGYSIRVSMWID
jgi:hypothetical protein